jgi:NAD(P)H-hydrate epimerase
VEPEITAGTRQATLVVDALLGTGLAGPAAGRMLEAIREINGGFPLARVIAVDIPSGMPSDSGQPVGEFARADATVTFTAPKVAHVMPPNANHVGELRVAAIGSPPSLYEEDARIYLSLVEVARFRHLFGPRPRGGHKGTFGHVLVVGGSRGKTGAAALAGMAALRAGAGLVTVASAATALPTIAAHAAELMTEPLEETATGAIGARAWERLRVLAADKTVVAMGPGLGREAETAGVVARASAEFPQPMVCDADALVEGFSGASGRLRVLTPHPGEMARLVGREPGEVQADRIGCARGYAIERGVCLVLKGERTLIAFPDGRVWINPTGTPALATGGSGDVLTGMIAGLLAQFPADAENAVAAAVYLHGRAGELGAARWGEKGLVAGGILECLPAAMEECAGLPHGV